LRAIPSSTSAAPEVKPALSVGDTAVHGAEGLRFYTRLKTMPARWPADIRAGAEYIMPTTR